MSLVQGGWHPCFHDNQYLFQERSKEPKQLCYGPTVLEALDNRSQKWRGFKTAFMWSSKPISHLWKENLVAGRGVYFLRFKGLAAFLCCSCLAYVIEATAASSCSFQENIWEQRDLYSIEAWRKVFLKDFHIDPMMPKGQEWGRHRKPASVHCIVLMGFQAQAWRRKLDHLCIMVTISCPPDMLFSTISHDMYCTMCKLMFKYWPMAVMSWQRWYDLVPRVNTFYLINYNHGKF